MRLTDVETPGVVMFCNHCCKHVFGLARIVEETTVRKISCCDFSLSLAFSEETKMPRVGKMGVWTSTQIAVYTRNFFLPLQPSPLDGRRRIDRCGGSTGDLWNANPRLCLGLPPPPAVTLARWRLENSWPTFTLPLCRRGVVFLLLWYRGYYIYFVKGLPTSTIICIGVTLCLPPCLSCHAAIERSLCKISPTATNSFSWQTVTATRG